MKWTLLVLHHTSKEISILENWIKNKELPEFYKNGYEVLLDKTGIANKLPKPTFDGRR